MGDWEKVCQLLHSQDILVKNLPKKPKRPQKPKLKEIEEETAGDGPNEEEGLDNAALMRADKSVTGCHTLGPGVVSRDIWTDISINVALGAAIPNRFQTWYEVP